MSEKLTIFKQIIRESNYENTYKMAWAKSIVELSTQIDLSEENVKISLVDIAEKFVKYYWNQTIFFDLRQGSNPDKQPTINTQVKNLIQKFFMLTNSNAPIFFEKAELRFNELNLLKDFETLIGITVNTLKKDVSWRFTYLDKSYHVLYELNKKENWINVDSNFLKELRDNHQDLFDLINYRWGLILETFNSSPRINKKVKIMDEREIKRKPLSKYKPLLNLENAHHHCFICQKPIDENHVSIDHVIPWSYLYSDDIWNLVYVCKECNSSKSNRIPKEEEINDLIDRNKRLLLIMEKHGIKNIYYSELILSLEKDLVQKFWISSKS